MELQSRLRNAVLFLALLFVVGTLGYKQLGGPQTTYLDCFYMTLISVTTIGYGEFVLPGADSANAAADMNNIRIFTSFIIICGVGTLAYVMTTLTALIVEGELTTLLRRRKMERAIAKLRDHYIVCGLGETGYHIVEELDKNLHPTVVIDHNPERLKKLEGLKNVLHLTGDATDEDVLKAAGIEHARGIILVLPSDKDNLFITVTAKQMNPDVRIVAKGIDAKAKTKLVKAGADAVVAPNLIGGLRMASEMVRPTAVGFLDTMLRAQTKTLRIDEVEVGPGSEFDGRTLPELRLKDRFGILVLAFKKSGDDEMHFNPPVTEKFASGTRLIVMGDARDIHRARETGATKRP